MIVSILLVAFFHLLFLSCLPSSSYSTTVTSPFSFFLRLIRIITDRSHLPPSYDVFISFRGPDVRYTFKEHLRAAIERKGLTVFCDDGEELRGQIVQESILSAIERSTCHVVVLSEKFASSTYCLDELVKIMECSTAAAGRGSCCLPVFYRIPAADPSGGCFKKYLELHMKSCSYERVQGWIRALGWLRGLGGWVCTGKESEAKLVETIATTIQEKVLELA